MMFECAAPNSSGAGRVRRFLEEERGATAIEYGLVAGALAIAIVAFLPGVTQAITGLFQPIVGSIASVA